MILKLHITLKNFVSAVLGICIVLLAIIPLLVDPQKLGRWRAWTILLGAIGVIALIAQALLQSKEDHEIEEREKQRDGTITELVETMKANPVARPALPGVTNVQTATMSGLSNHRPRLALAATPRTAANWFQEPHLFSLSHLGGDAAQYVQVEPIQSARGGKLWIHFDQIPFLDEREKTSFPRFWLDIGGRCLAHDKAGNVRFVFFQRDASLQDKSSVDYPVVVSFRWGKESLTEKFRLTWDQKRERLHVSPWD